MRNRAVVIFLGVSIVWAGAAGAERKPDVGFVPTPMAAVERMVEMAEIKPGDVVYDLGCGGACVKILGGTSPGNRWFHPCGTSLTSSR